MDPLNQPMEWVPRLFNGKPKLKKSYSRTHGVLYGFEDCYLVPKGSEPELAKWWSRLPQMVAEIES